MKTHATSFNQSVEKRLAYTSPIIGKASLNLNTKPRKKREGFSPSAARGEGAVIFFTDVMANAPTSVENKVENYDRLGDPFPGCARHMAGARQDGADVMNRIAAAMTSENQEAINAGGDLWLVAAASVSHCWHITEQVNDITAGIVASLLARSAATCAHSANEFACRKKRI